MSQLLYHRDPMILKESFSAALDHSPPLETNRKPWFTVTKDGARVIGQSASAGAREKASDAAVVVKSPGHRDVMLGGELDGNRHSGRAGVASSSGIQESPSGSRYGSGGMTGRRD